MEQQLIFGKVNPLTRHEWIIEPDFLVSEVDGIEPDEWAISVVQTFTHGGRVPSNSYTKWVDRAVMGHIASFLEIAAEGLVTAESRDGYWEPDGLGVGLATHRMGTVDGLFLSVEKEWWTRGQRMGYSIAVERDELLAAAQWWRDLSKLAVPKSHSKLQNYI